MIREWYKVNIIMNSAFCIVEEPSVLQHGE